MLDGGIGSNMPANTTFGINTDTLRMRYHPNRNFDKLFEGDGMTPIDKDAVAQFIGLMGELTMVNPMFNWRLYDSNPAHSPFNVVRMGDVSVLWSGLTSRPEVENEIACKIAVERGCLIRC